MRIAILSDIHGNAIALEAALADMAQFAPDRVICLGDVATIGVQPLESLEILHQIPEVACIVGNHDAALLESGPVTAFGIDAALQEGIDWCREKITPAQRARMETYQPWIEVELDPETKMLCFHGSPQTHTDILLEDTPLPQLERFFSEHSVEVWVGGHTHIPYRRWFAGGMVANPGSIGAAFGSPPVPGRPPVIAPWVQYAVLTHENGKTQVDLRQLSLDTTAVVGIIQQSRSPIKEMLLKSYL